MHCFLYFSLFSEVSGLVSRLFFYFFLVSFFKKHHNVKYHDRDICVMGLQGIFYPLIFNVPLGEWEKIPQL
jgi:hypothetical protein